MGIPYEQVISSPYGKSQGWLLGKCIKQHKEGIEGTIGWGKNKRPLPEKDSAPHTLEQMKSLLGIECSLWLTGLTELSASTATALSKHIGPLVLDGLTALSDAAALAIAEHKGSLSLDGLTELSADTAVALSKHEGALSLGGLTELSVNSATVLSALEGFLSLDGLAELSADTATALSKHKGPLSLNGLTSLSDELAEVLAKHKGHIHLMGLEKLSHYGATQLVNLPSASMRRSYLGSAAQKVFKEAGTWDDQTWTQNP